MIEEHSPNSLQSGLAEQILPGGECTVRSDGLVHLVANVVPGDELLFQATDKRRGTLRGALESVIVPSPKRVDASCDQASSCGGCVLQYVSKDEQLIVKSEWVRQAFAGFFDTETAWHRLKTFNMGKRRRLRWYIGKDEGGSFLGFYARNSHDVIRADHCMVITPELDVLRQKIQYLLLASACDDIVAIQAVHLFDGIHVIIETEYHLQSHPFVSLNKVDDFPIQWWQRQDGITRPFIKPIQRFHDQLKLNTQTIHISVGPDDFIQGQQEGNQLIIEQVVDWCRDAAFVVDLFAGIGNLSLPVAVLTGTRVTGAELSINSVRAANANAKLLGIQAEYQQINLFDKADLQAFAGADVLILDPPRKGAKRICQQMGALLPKKIIMIHCDVASGGRDGSILKGLGYKLRQLKVVDLFPYAGHVEAMSLWSR